MSIDALQEAIRKRKNPSVLSLCPALSMLPPHLLADAAARLGKTPAAAAFAYETFCLAILDALADTVPAVSVDSGCFAALGAEGVAAMQRILSAAAGRGYYVLLNSMRSDLPPAADALADACFGAIPFEDAAFTPYPCDGVILNAFCGSDGFLPYTGFCAGGKNVFLLARTPNRSAREVQDQLSGDRLFYQVMADLAMRKLPPNEGRYGYCEVGVVAGLTEPAALKTLRQKCPHLFLLVPGYGAQGGLAKNAPLAFDRMGHGAAVMAGRSILYAFSKNDPDSRDYALCAREAALSMREKLLSFLTVI